MLNIVKSGAGETLTYALEGRLDTTTAPQLEAELKGALDGVKKLVLDLIRRTARAARHTESDESAGRNDAD